jgi:ergothioneine biosynthesis protein EgtB
LCVEDYGVQPMADASPPKWHLAHTTWFFETFLLKHFVTGYRPFHERFEYLFNSYYNGVGRPYPRLRRGALSRPTVAEVFDYRRHVDDAMTSLLERSERDVIGRIELGLHHEQQHQELLLTDIKYTLGTNPLLPPYRVDLRDARAPSEAGSGHSAAADFAEFEGGIVAIGAPASGRPGLGEVLAEAFCFDNELPRHDVLLQPFALAARPVSNGEFLSFIEDGGYRRPELWLSDGWSALAGLPPVDAPDRLPGADLRAGPLYWYREAGEWYEYRLSGPSPLDLAAPLAHVNFYEADAYARWAGCRLPREQEWEYAAAGHAVAGNFADSDALHPLCAPLRAPLRAPMPTRSPGKELQPVQLFGDVWEWTSSPYVAYPGFRPAPGALGEYNGKFMSNQLVLRGGSCVSPPAHVRRTYRNFFYPGDRWQFTGIRLARDV